MHGCPRQIVGVWSDELISNLPVLVAMDSNSGDSTPGRVAVEATSIIECLTEHRGAVREWGQGAVGPVDMSVSVIACAGLGRVEKFWLADGPVWTRTDWMESLQVGFRRVEERDVGLLHRWLNEPGVVAWWEGNDVSWEAVTRDYVNTTDGTEHWICQVNGDDAGWIQCYPATAFPEETEPWFDLGVDRSAAGIDYLIGEASMRGRGVGAAMIRSFVHDVVFDRHPDWTQACAAPFAANKGSWRAMAKAGFRRLGVIEDDDGECNVMVLDRPEPE